MRRLIAWSVDNPLIVMLMAIALAIAGGYAFQRVNVEAYPDPAPAILEVVAQYPGASAEEVERQVTIPLEIALAGMTGLKSTRSKSLFGLAYLNNQFEYGVDYLQARQDVINRLQSVELPSGVQPEISPRSPIGEIYRYKVASPLDENGKEIYTLNDLKSLQDWVIRREFRRIPGVADVVSFGGTVKCYEVRPDPDLLKQYGVTLSELEDAIAKGNSNVGGNYLNQGDTVQVLRSLGLIGGGKDPLLKVLGLRSPQLARDRLREEERRRVLEIRKIVVKSTDNVPVRVEHLVEGGAIGGGERLGEQGVVVSYRTRMGKVSLSRPELGDQGEVVTKEGVTRWRDEDDIVQGLVLLRKGADSLPTLRLVEAKVEELNNEPGRLPPGVKLEPYYNRTDLIAVTTHTVRENLIVGMALVTVVLLSFLGNVRSAIIVAINIPLALLFAFGALYLRHESANLLSIGAVDFGIIVEASVIMVENIYRRVSGGIDADLPLRDRIVNACYEVDRGLLFSTGIMVCAFIPLFTMTGPEGRIFGPMARTYALALGGGLVLAMMLAPVLCSLAFHRLKPARDNFLARSIKSLYVRQLEWCLDHRVLTLGAAALLVVATLGAMPFLGREFMPELDEGHLWIRGIFAPNVTLDEVGDKTAHARSIMRKYPEVELVVCQMGRPDAGTDPTSFYSSEFLVPLKPPSEWPKVVPAQGWRSLFTKFRARTKVELIQEMNRELNRDLIGIDWNISQQIRDNVMEVLSGVQGENAVKIIGPDLSELESIAERVKNELASVPGVENPAVFRVQGQSHLEFPIDREKCALWNVSVADVQDVIQTAVGGKPFTEVIEGEARHDVQLRWPERLRDSESAILDIPVDIIRHTVTSEHQSDSEGSSASGGNSRLSSTGTTLAMPSVTGSTTGGAIATVGTLPRQRLRDLITPLDDKDEPDPSGAYVRPGASIVFREQGRRLIAVKFSVRGRDLASVVAEAQARAEPLIPAPYRAEWSGEFENMKQAERRMVALCGLAMLLIVLLLYMAFRSFADMAVVLSNVVAMSLGGLWALLLTGEHFNISAAVGFISILGVAVMSGLLLVSTFNGSRSHGVPLRQALRDGIETRSRALTMTAFTALFGLLPAATSTAIGSQSQRPLALVVVGGMSATMLLLNLVPVLYSLYGERTPVEGGSGLSH